MTEPKIPEDGASPSDPEGPANSEAPEYLDLPPELAGVYGPDASAGTDGEGEYDAGDDDSHERDRFPSARHARIVVIVLIVAVVVYYLGNLVAVNWASPAVGSGVQQQADHWVRALDHVQRRQLVDGVQPGSDEYRELTATALPDLDSDLRTCLIKGIVTAPPDGHKVRGSNVSLSGSPEVLKMTNGYPELVRVPFLSTTVIDGLGQAGGEYPVEFRLDGNGQVVDLRHEGPGVGMFGPWCRQA